MLKLTNKTTNLIAFFLLTVCFLVSLSSIQNMALTMDEQAHIPSGYSYMKYQDYRLNPEHPPLAKDLSAIPLLFLDLNFPTEHQCWTEEVNSQWVCGMKFIFESGNNADFLIFFARLPMIMLLILLGWFIYFWTKKLAGNKAALLALTLFSFSPTLIAHGRLVTTDIAAAFGVLFATYFWINFIKKPNKKNILIAGLTLGIALCLKFSLILLIPSLGLATIIYALFNKPFKEVFKYMGLSALAGLVAVVLAIWPIYALHTYNYPTEKQVSDTEEILFSNDNPLRNFGVWTVKNPITRPVGHYLLGLLMATQRVAGGNTVYFLGQVSGDAWMSYFPIMYFLKAPLAFHLLTLIALILWLSYLKKRRIFKKPITKLGVWLKEHLTEFSLLLFFIIYWVTSITGNLNIGVRHIIPIFPILYILISLAIVKFSEQLNNKKLKFSLGIIIFVLLAWYIISSLMAFPLYLSYYNELAGGSKNGYKYAVDSNYDWGQDLKRLADFVEENNIEKISVAYFGGDNSHYRLGNKIEKTWIHRNPEENHGWMAISSTFLQEGRAKPALGFDRDTTFFNWLNEYEPAGRAGHSIFIYNIE
jgi:hypothetical protein